jgi:hypothetical protein
MSVSARVILQCLLAGSTVILTARLHSLHNQAFFILPPSQALPYIQCNEQALCNITPMEKCLENTETCIQNNHTYDQYEFSIESSSAPECFPMKEEDIDFTLVTQLSFNRLSMMRQHCERWGDHPISLAIGTTKNLETVQKALSQLGCKNEMITVSLISDFNSEEEYPVNRLRNLAMSHIKTSHAVIIDADFVLSVGLFEILHMHRATLAADYLNALVIPAFELRKVCEEQTLNCTALHIAMLPHNKDELLKLYRGATEVYSNSSSVTQSNGRGNFHGHASTRYTDWITQPAEQLLPIECVTSDRYEPYLVVRHCRALPPFQKVFVGYGQNKITWLQQVRRAGYKFFQTGEGFVIHLPHRKSVSSVKWKKARLKDRGSVEVEKVAEAFRAWMTEYIPDNSQIPYCS